MKLDGVGFRSGQALRDITQIDRDTVFAVGDFGMVIRGRREGDEWRWKTLESGIEQHLLSIAYEHERRILWAVGTGGIILKSTDGGDRWKVSLVEDDRKQIVDIDGDLHRIRFTENGVWIVGDRVVLKSK
jgi:photosystem II stability/assembly factor-like uncharacterized protein